MAFLRRLLGGADRTGPGAPGTPDQPGPAGGSGGPGAPDAPVGEDEAERERRLLREEAERLDDELIQRQLRYADRSWTPPAQGGPRRADDGEADEG